RKDRLGAGENCLACWRDGVERAACREAFELAAVEQARIDAVGEVVERLERSIGDPLFAELLHRLLADALECAQRITDAYALDRKLGFARIDAGRQARHAEAAHVV